MFKKKLAILVAAAMLTLSAGSAFASFGNLELIRVVYNQGTATSPGTTEIATDLGTVSSVMAGGTFGNGVSAFTAQTGGTSFNNLYVAYYAIDNTNNHLWVTGNPAAQPNKGAIILGSTAAVSTYYNTLTPTGSTVAAAADNTSSYRSVLDNVLAFGSMGGFLDTTNGDLTNASLAALANGGSVTQQVYYFDNFGTGSGRGAVAPTGVASFDITTNADGSTTTPVATPIPAAFYLMGSGLMGLVGLRRRNKA